MSNITGIATLPTGVDYIVFAGIFVTISALVRLVNNIRDIEWMKFHPYFKHEPSIMKNFLSIPFGFVWDIVHFASALILWGIYLLAGIDFATATTDLTVNGVNYGMFLALVLLHVFYLIASNRWIGSFMDTDRDGVTLKYPGWSLTFTAILALWTILEFVLACVLYSNYNGSTVNNWGLRVLPLIGTIVVGAWHIIAFIVHAVAYSQFTGDWKRDFRLDFSANVAPRANGYDMVNTKNAVPAAIPGFFLNSVKTS